MTTDNFFIQTFKHSNISSRLHPGCFALQIEHERSRIVKCKVNTFAVEDVILKWTLFTPRDDSDTSANARSGRSIASNYGNAGGLPACAAVYLFADGPAGPPCISRVDSRPGTPQDWAPAHPARPAQSTDTRHTYVHRISFPTGKTGWSKRFVHFWDHFSG